jgi:hypothetical protein
MTTRLAGGIALVLAVVSIFLIVAFHSIELVEEGSSLAELHAQQEQPLREALTQRHRFEALSSGINALADEGDAAAKLVVDTLRRQGLNLPSRKP